jgi:outer membrane receptor for ferrienterochelin and colicin
MEQLQITAGARFDLSSNFEPALSPRAAVVYRPWPEHAFRLSYAWAFRKPCLYESHVHPDVQVINPAMPQAHDVFARSIGNEDLKNERVQSIEAGWRGSFLENSLEASVDLFVNFYADTITYVIEMPLHMGLPDMQNSSNRYENQDDGFTAIGGEAEIGWRPFHSWTLWANLAVRRLSTADRPGGLPSEDQLRINLGARYLPDQGLLADLAFHYVSACHQAMLDPYNMLNDLETHRVDGGLLLIGRIGYRVGLEQERALEGGMTVRTPLGLPFREYPGISFPDNDQSLSAADFGGELLRRMVAFYLRLVF